MQGRILAKAEELSRTLGFRAITMDELATNLGISKKTIYQYYSDKNSLVDSVVSTIIQGTQAKCHNTTLKSENAIDEIFITMKNIRKDFQNLNPIVLHDLEKYFPETYEKFQEHKNNFIYELIYQNLVNGIAEGYYRNEIKPEILARFRIESMLMAFNQNIFPAKKFKLAEVTQAILEHFLYGIATPKGLLLIEKYKSK
ncbi:MAG: TetR/AcrR family transcriptional regulator [Saprospiraceae bacterium]|nr:TetR/AcrR family transcriptional regulator [Saprospiraceae bacterium]MBL0025423.1 TetR/AcrR family transcriptional regulator [Saprospiraceae bacterium]